MRWLTTWVVLAAAAALCGGPSHPPARMQFAAAVSAESPALDSGSPRATNGGSLLTTSAAESGAATLATAFTDDHGTDEMLRNPQGQRQHWTTVPELVVLTSVMEYHMSGRNEYRATAEQLTGDDVESLVVDLTSALRLLTDNTFEQFATIHREAVPAGTSASVVRPKQIVVGRYRGVLRLEKTIGFGGRRAQRDGAITGAAIVLDSDYDRTSVLRRLLRTHELGHALGYNHVESRLSIMNPRIGPEPTDFDRQAVKVAFRGIDLLDPPGIGQ
jgi:hypothetical protein